MPFAADLAALHGIGLTTGRNDGLAPAAGKAVAHRSVVVVAPADYAAALGNSSAAAADNFAVAAIRNSAGAAIDNYPAQNNCAPAEADIGAGIQAGWILVVPDASVAIGSVPGGRDGDRCDDSAQGTALPPKPAS